MRKLVVTLLLCIVAAAAILEVKLAAQQYQRLQREMSARTPHAG
ncbi:MAG TPA: hypothetical protein VKG20_19900 [Methylomirabilota bacterium]|nr:hypothetical protein [Methylomirabilota bacterium]